MFRRRKEAQSDTQTRVLYYASDVHGSDQCWRKFLGAARFYDASDLIMGGDLIGKAIVPIARDESGAFSCNFLGKTLRGSSDEELKEVTDAVRFNGMYPWVAPPEEVKRGKESAEVRDAVFSRVILEELTRWIALADEKMGPRGVGMFVMAGNDDPFECDEVLASASHVTFCDDRVVRIGEHEMISFSYANPTPWDSPRELPEDELYDRLKRLAEQLEDPARAIMNLHVPPYDSGLDTAAEIDETLAVVHRGGQPNPIPVGSTAVRQIIEEYQPMLALHGHIHESRGATHIGRTLALNSGSEYNSGRIHGALVKLTPDDVVSHQFVVG